jgi:hypothetical protein
MVDGKIFLAPAEYFAIYYGFSAVLSSLTQSARESHALTAYLDYFIKKNFTAS